MIDAEIPIDEIHKEMSAELVRIVHEEAPDEVYQPLNLDDRTRFLIGALIRLGGREDFSFTEMEDRFDRDRRFLRKKSREYADDPILGCVVRAVDLVETIDDAGE